MTALKQVNIELAHGLEGDRFSGRAASTRQVTLIQHEHLAVIAACLRGAAPAQDRAHTTANANPAARPATGSLDPALLRRNIVVAGINLLALKDKTFLLGEVLLEYTGLCHPCSKMERLLGPGGYNAMRGHGGITARVLEPGRLHLQDTVSYAEHA